MRFAKTSFLIREIVEALNSLGGWGSLEIFVQDNKVTQITRRAIKKTNHKLPSLEDKKEKEEISEIQNSDTIVSVR